METKIVLDGAVITWPPETKQLANFTDEQLFEGSKVYAERMRLLGVAECSECFQFGEHICSAKN